MIQKIEDPNTIQGNQYVPAKEQEVTALPDKTESKTKADDLRYFKLSKPITAGNQKFDKLLLDASELSGKTYFSLVARFRAECPDIYRSSFNKLAEERFLSYIVAELNPPMVVEDVQKITFKDLPIMFLQMASFLFADRTTGEPEPTTTP